MTNDSSTHPADTEQSDILIIGSGFAGLCMGIQLEQAGFHSFTILERANEVGGTWRDNHYPGCACDVESPLYSYSFEPNPRWSRMFAEQREIQDYLRHCADKYRIRPHIRLSENVVGAHFDDARKRWIVRTGGGREYRARVLVSAVGALSNPAFPDLPGLERFEGVDFHSADWKHDYRFEGKRVAVIGTGASAIQFVPQIAPRVASLTVYQRTPPWIMPKPDRRFGALEQSLYRRVPFLQKLLRWAIYWKLEMRVLGFIHPKLMSAVERQARRSIRKQIKSRTLREKLTPDYTIGCKRVLISDDYYPTLERPNVELVTEPIAEVRPHSIVTADGRERAVDAIIYGTGFKVQEFVPRGMFVGRGGRDLADAWVAGVQAYKGTTVAGFPNLFMLLGPNTGLGHSSMVYMIESQVAYVLDAVREMRSQGWSSVEVDPAVQSTYNQELQTRHSSAVWQSGCRSWYLDAKGRNTALWPGFTFRFRKATRRFDAECYRVEPASDQHAEEAASELAPPPSRRVRAS